MTGFTQNLRYALRQLRKSPGFTAVAVITLAVGIGATATMFSVIDVVVLRPLPYNNVKRIVDVQTSSASGSRALWQCLPHGFQPGARPGSIP